jgi:hypothetical protein
MFAITRIYGPNVAPALNLLNSGWVVWEGFCRCVKDRRPVAVSHTDMPDITVHYNAGSLNEIQIWDKAERTVFQLDN